MLSPNSDSGAQDLALDARIQCVLEQATAQLLAGIPVDRAALEASHPELMPELSRRLHDLELIFRANQMASGEAGKVNAAPDNDQRDLELLVNDLETYRILHRIHRGGQGAVYRAIEVATNRPVAIKVILAGPLASPRQRRRFLREIKLTARLSHPHIVMIYGSGLVGAQPYYIMEYVAGVAITDYAIVEGLAARARVELIVTVARAVAHAHKLGIIHRDLKPSNILVDSEGQPHILDFGLAKALDSAEQAEDSISLLGNVVGTLPYLSPEQAAGQDELDTRSDIYSLALVLFEVLTGELPYDVEGDRKVVRANILNAVPKRITECLAEAGDDGYPSRRQIGPDLEAIMARALAKDAERRYQTADEFAADLERYLSGQAVQARTGQNLYVLRKTLSRYKLQVVVAGIFLLLLAGVTFTVTRAWLSARRQRDTAREATRLAHATFDQVISEVDDSVRHLEGGPAVRDHLLDSMDGNLSRLASLVQHDAAMIDVATSVSEKRGDHALADGAFEQARQYFAEALKGAEENSNVEPAAKLLRRLRLTRKLAATEENPLPLLEQAMILATSAPDSTRTDDEMSLATCAVACDRARYLVDRGSYKEARSALQSAETSAATVLANIGAARGAWLDAVATLRSLQSNTALHLGEIRAARAALEVSIELRRVVLRAQSADVVTQCRIISAEVRLGEMLRDAGEVESAASAFARASAVGAELHEVKSASVDMQYRLAAVHEMLARAHLALQRGGAAIEQADSAIEMAKILAQRDPERTAWQRLLGFCLLTRGRVALADQRHAAALDDLTQAAAAREALAMRRPDNSALQAEWADALDALGDALRDRDPSGAVGRYRAALVVREKTADSQPDVATYQLDVVYTMNRLGELLLLQPQAARDGEAGLLLQRATDRLLAIRSRWSLGAGEVHVQAVTSSPWAKIHVSDFEGPLSLHSDDTRSAEDTFTRYPKRWAPPSGG